MQGLTVTGQNTLVFVNPGTNASLQILRCWASQYGTTTSQQLGIQLNTQVSGFPTLTSVTPSQLDTSDPASKIVGSTNGAAGTCGVNASAEGSGAKTILFADSFNNLNGWLFVATPAEQYTLPAGSSAGFGIYLVSIPNSTAFWNAGVTYCEV